VDAHRRWVDLCTRRVDVAALHRFDEGPTDVNDFDREVIGAAGLLSQNLVQLLMQIVRINGCSLSSVRERPRGALPTTDGIQAVWLEALHMVGDDIPQLEITFLGIPADEEFTGIRCPTFLVGRGERLRGLCGGEFLGQDRRERSYLNVCRTPTCPLGEVF
jgi:hypothetical protein